MGKLFLVQPVRPQNLPMVQKRPQCFSAKACARESWNLDVHTKSPRFLHFDLATSRLSCLSDAPHPKPLPQLDRGGAGVGGGAGAIADNDGAGGAGTAPCVRCFLAFGQVCMAGVIGSITSHGLERVIHVHMCL